MTIRNFRGIAQPPQRAGHGILWDIDALNRFEVK